MDIKNIIIGKTYNYFDDGKIRESRKMKVVITEIIPFKEIDDETLSIWEADVKQCNWLYATETDYFIKADLLITVDKTEQIVFVRTVDNDWFSLGLWGGRLDMDNKLTEWLEKDK